MYIGEPSIYSNRIVIRHHDIEFNRYTEEFDLLIYIDRVKKDF